MYQSPKILFNNFALAIRECTKIGKLVQNVKTPQKNVPNTLKKIPELCKSLTDNDSTCTMRRYHKLNIMEFKKESVSNYYSKEEVCAMLKISLSTLNRRIAGGELIATRVGGKVLISSENLDRYLNGEY